MLKFKGLVLHVSVFLWRTYLTLASKSYLDSYFATCRLVMDNILSIPWYRGIDSQYCRALLIPWYRFCIKLQSISIRELQNLKTAPKIEQPGLKIQMLHYGCVSKAWSLISLILLLCMQLMPCPIIPCILWYCNKSCATYRQLVSPIYATHYYCRSISTWV